ncbi:MAG: stage III sporulation protein AD [Peptococcia bacterium]|jgi:stage III sporulation protein AD
MEILQVVGIGLTGTILTVFLKESNKGAAVFVSLATGLILFIFALSKIGDVLDVMQELARRAQINMFYMTTVLKIMGIAYLAEFGAQICKDAGEGSIATKIELAAKILVMVLALPIIMAILESVLRLIPS